MDSPAPHASLPEPSRLALAGRWLRRRLTWAAMWLGGALLIFFATAVLLGVVYQDAIQRFVVRQMAEQLQAQVTIMGPVNISFWRSWPNISVDIHGLDIRLTPESARKHQFPTRQVLQAQRLRVTLDLLSFLGQREYVVKRIDLLTPQLHLIRNPRGVWIWEPVLVRLLQPSDAPDTTAFALDLRSIRARDAQLTYQDLTGAQTQVSFAGLDLDFSGRFAEQDFTLRIDAEGQLALLQQGRNVWLRNKRFALQTALAIEGGKDLYRVLEGNLAIETLRLALKGHLRADGPGYVMALRLESGQTDFRQFLGLLPGVYTQTVADMDIGGTFVLQTQIQGRYDARHFPIIEANFAVQRGGITYDERLGRLSDLDFRGAFYYNPQQPEDTRLRLDTLSGMLGGKPLKARLRYENFADPTIDLMLDGTLDLALVQAFLPSDTDSSAKYSGTVAGRLELAGRVADFAEQRFQRTTASGTLRFADVAATASWLPLPLSGFGAEFVITPQVLRIPKAQGRLGTSDFRLSGTASGYVAYLFEAHQPLDLALQLDCGFLDLNPWLLALEDKTPTETSPKTNPKTTASTESAKAKAQKTQANPSGAQATPYDIPDDVHLQLQARIGKFRIFQVEGTLLSGRLSLRAGTLRLEGVQAQLFGGSVQTTATLQQRTLQGELRIQRLELNPFLRAAEQLADLTLVGDHLYGTLSAEFQFSTRLDADFLLIPSTLEANGTCSLTQGKFLNFAPLIETAKFINLKKLHDLMFEDIQAKFWVKNSRLHTDQLDLRANDLRILIRGSHGFDQTLDYHLRFFLPKVTLLANGYKSNQPVTEWVEEQQAQQSQMSLLLHVTGTVDNPIFKLDKAAVKAKVKQDLVEERREATEAVKGGQQEIFGKQDSAKVDDWVEEAPSEGGKFIDGVKKIFKKKDKTAK